LPERLRWTLVRRQSIYIWIWTLAAFAIADLAALVLGLTGAL
jgi:hypothetical protein